MVIVCPVMIDHVYTDPYFIVLVKENNEFVGKIQLHSHETAAEPVYEAK